MSDMGYGVYVRIQNPTGALWSSNREEWVEVQQDLVNTFGQDFADAVVASLKGGMVKVEATAAPVLKVVPDEPLEAGHVMTAEEVQTALTQPDEPKVSFDTCEVCGGLKDKWNPPGVSRQGKKYPGFYGCSNFRNHPR